MTRNSSTTAHRSGLTGLIVGASLIVITVAIAVVAAKPGSNPAATQGAATSATPAGAPPAATMAAVAAPSAAGLTAREVGFDFGNISMAAGKVTHRFWFRNDGAAPVLVKRIYTSCMCTTATLVKATRIIGTYGMPGHGVLPDVDESFVPGEAAYLDVVFDPAAHGPAGLGRTERVVSIESDAGQRMQLGFVATVRP